MAAADSPAGEPKNASNAGTKLPVASPCRYSSGSTAATLGLLRHYGGRITSGTGLLASHRIDAPVVPPAARGPGYHRPR
jgi:hypothetical protein